MQHHVALPPGSMGKVSYIAQAGQYSLQVSMKIIFRFLLLPLLFDCCLTICINCLQDTVLELEFQGIKKKVTMLQVND